MKKTITLSLTLFCAVFFISDAFSFKLGGKDLVRSGTGNRTMTLVGSVYSASLWVPAELKGKSSKEIIDANEPSAVIMTVTSMLITKDRFVKAVSDGFVKASSSGYKTDKSQQFLNLFNNLEIKKGDHIYLQYTPAAGLSASIKSKETGKTHSAGTIQGLDFKKALFAIWLGPAPVQESLKKGMLGL